MTFVKHFYVMQSYQELSALNKNQKIIWRHCYLSLLNLQLLKHRKEFQETFIITMNP